MFDEQSFKIDYVCASLWGTIAIGGPVSWGILVWVLI
jgi:hypothetical protein